MGISISRILKCTGLSIILTAAAILILSVLSYCTAINENAITVAVYVSVVVCVFIGALLSARLADSKALLNAAAVSVIYYAVLLALTIIINKTINFNSHAITMTIGIFGAGVLGAILGK